MNRMIGYSAHIKGLKRIKVQDRRPFCRNPLAKRKLNNNPGPSIITNVPMPKLKSLAKQ